VDLRGEENLKEVPETARWHNEFERLRHTDWCFVVFVGGEQSRRPLVMAVFESEDAFRAANAADFDDRSQMLLLEYVEEHSAQGTDRVYFKLEDDTICCILAPNAQEINRKLQVRPSMILVASPID
jgi:hypothetical protein